MDECASDHIRPMSDRIPLGHRHGIEWLVWTSLRRIWSGEVPHVVA